MKHIGKSQKIKIFDNDGNFIEWKVSVSKKYIKERKKELSNIWIKLKDEKETK